MRIHKIASIGVAASLLAAGVVLAGPASAEPVSPSLSIVGSDTLQDVVGALVNGTNASGSFVRVNYGGVGIGSYDAFGTRAIQTKAGGPLFGRPTGSGQGRLALLASINSTTFQSTTSPYSTVPAANIGSQVDVARSSSGPSTSTTDSLNVLTYVPFGRDAISYLYRAADSSAATVLAGLTASQLTTIYSAATPTTIGGVTITPRLPQSSSGTRTTFLAAINVSTVGAAVPTTDNTVTAENDASVLTDNQIIPVSVAQYIAQKNGASASTFPTTGLGNATFGLGSMVPGAAPYLTSGSKLVPNPTYYYNATWGRDTYLVIQRSRLGQDAKFDALFLFKNDADPFWDPTTSLAQFGVSDTVDSGTPGSVKLVFGFLPVDGDPGTPGIQDPVYKYGQ